MPVHPLTTDLTSPLVSSPTTRPSWATVGGSAPWSPLALFAGGELGAVGDLTDPSLLLQAIAGAAVTTLGDPIGFAADLRLPELRSAFQATSAHRPILGRVPPRGRVNLLRWSDAPTNAYWTKTQSTASQSGGIYRLTANSVTAGNNPRMLRAQLVAISTVCTLTVEVRRGNYDYIMLTPSTAAGAQSAYDSGINLSTLTWITGGANIGTRTITELADGWVRLRVTCTTGTGDTQRGFAIRLVSSDGTSGSVTMAGTEYVELRRMQIELGGSPTAYQLVTEPHDVTESGQPAIWHAFNDGVDDKLFIATPNMGSACTVAHRHETGVTYLENQTIGASTYKLPSPQRLFRYLVINRGLTSEEKALLTPWLAGGMAT